MKGPRTRAVVSCRAVGLALATTLGPTIASSARAEPKSGETAADVLFERAKQQLRAGDWVSACNNFEASMKLDPSVSTQIKLARCREHDGKYLDAFVAYLQARELNAKNDSNEARRRELASAIDAGMGALDPHLAKLRVTVSPGTAQATFEIDARPPLRDPRDGAWVQLPGKATLRVTAPGFSEQQLLLTLDAGVTRALEVELSMLSQPETPSSGAPPPASAAPAMVPVQTTSIAHAPAPTRPSAEEPRSSPSAQRIVAYVTGGAGLVTLGCAGYFAVRTLSLVAESRDHCDDDNECSREGVRLVENARDAQATGFALLAAGGTLVGASIVLFATERKPNPNASSKLQANVSPFHVSLSGVF
ncbi:MAG: tetratricopeptide repeat protein [Myxococcota bacterium]